MLCSQPLQLPWGYGQTPSPEWSRWNLREWACRATSCSWQCHCQQTHLCLFILPREAGCGSVNISSPGAVARDRQEGKAPQTHCLVKCGCWHAPTKCLTGPSLRQKALPSPHGSCLSAPQMWEDCYSCLHSPPLHCQGEPWLGIGLQNACSTNPVASVHALERDFREQGPPSPPVPLRHLFPFFIPPSSTPGVHPAFTLHRQGCCNGDGETETFYEPILLPPPNPCPSS